MSNFILTRDDFIKLGRVEEWDKYENDNERTMRFFIDGVKLTFDELSTLGHKKDYRGILFENKRRKERDDHKRLTPDMEYEYDHRDYVVYYPPEKCVASAIDDFCVDISTLLETVFDPDTIGYDFVIRLAGLIPYVMQQEPELAGGLINTLFDFRDEVATSLKNWPKSGYPSISGMLFANVGFMGMKVLDAYFAKVREVIQDLHDDKIDLKETIKQMRANKDEKAPLRNIVYKTIRDRESDHGSSPEEFTQIMAWHLARAVLNGEMDFAKYLAKNIDVLKRISKKYRLKYKELEDEAENERVKFYAKQNSNPPEYKPKLSLKTFQKYEKKSSEPISSAIEAKERKKWFFSEIPSRDNSPLNFVKLLKKYLNRKYRKNDEKFDTTG